MNILGTRSWTLAGNGRNEFYQVVSLLVLRQWLKTCLCDMFWDWYICTINEVNGDELSLLLKDIKLDIHDNIDLIPWGNFNFTVYNLSCFEKGLLTPPVGGGEWSTGG